MGNATFFEDVEFRGRNKVIDFVFEDELDHVPLVQEKLVPIPTIAFDNV